MSTQNTVVCASCNNIASYGTTNCPRCLKKIKYNSYEESFEEISWWAQYMPKNYTAYASNHEPRKDNYFGLRLETRRLSSAAKIYFAFALAKLTTVILFTLWVGLMNYFRWNYFHTLLGWVPSDSLIGNFTLLILSPVIGTVLGVIFSWQSLQSGYRLLRERDELLIKLDSAINLAIIATAVQSQRVDSQQEQSKVG